MKYTQLSNPDIILMEPQVFSDHRGFFMETFREDAFQKSIAPVCFVQDNHSKSTRGIGFYVLSMDVEVVYKCTDYYAPEYERTLLWNDPFIAIDWPILPGTFPILSEKDARGLSLESAEVFE